MSDDLNLTLHHERPGPKGPGRRVAVLLILVLAVGIINVVLALRPEEKRTISIGGLSRENLEELALKLEKQDLPGAAARVWIEYLDATKPATEERARIWYRIGKIYQNGGDYERALEAYYRSEATMGLDELATEIGRRTAECLENLGRFAALRFELEERTSYTAGDSTAGSDVLAEIGSWKITRAELDMMVEAEIEAQLSQLAGSLAPEERRMKKERLLDQVLREGERGRWLERFIAEELLYRSAREEGIYENPEVRSLLRNVERKLLAQKMMDREYASRITAIPEELRSYYDSHMDDFKVDGAQKGFEESRNEVYAAVRMQKEMAIQREVLESLMEKYDVVIHRSRL
ncbi:MAG TPA: hypothetical protein VMX58_07140 [Patescibacteria group bacterium]|nr:hypothetical protein [Patescibacteria group bacterium]